MKHNEQPKEAVQGGEVLTWQELARRFGFSKRTMAEMARRGLRSVTVGHKKLVLASWFTEFLQQIEKEQNDARVPEVCDSI
jgi:hypothetical protein